MAVLTVADLMTRDPICIQADDTLRAAWEAMESAAIRHLPVVDDDGLLVGVLTHRDMVRHALAGLEGVPINRVMDYLELRTVGSAMMGGPATSEPAEPAAEAADRMLENKFGCLPVVEGQRVVGILTEADFVRFVAETEREVAG